MFSDLDQYFYIFGNLYVDIVFRFWQRLYFSSAENFIVSIID